MRKSRLAAALAGVAALLMATTSPATAVVDGTTDTAGLYPNVGGLQILSQGEWFDFCSGTLIAPNVVLTAAHCTAFFTGDVGDPDEFGPDDWRISFDADPDENSTYYGADHFVIHPDWLANSPGPGGGNSKRSFLKEGLEDIALVYLTEDVAGIDPAPVAPTTIGTRSTQPRRRSPWSGTEPTSSSPAVSPHRGQSPCTTVRAATGTPR